MTTETEPDYAAIDAARIEAWRNGRDVEAVLSVQNFEVIAERVAAMFPVGQRFAIVSEFLGDSIPEVVTSTTRDTRGGMIQDGWRQTNDGTHAGFTLYAEHYLMGIGAGTSWATEREARAEMSRLHAYRWAEASAADKALGRIFEWAPRDGVGLRSYKGFTYVSLHQRDEGHRKARLVILYTNEHGVTRRTTVIPEYVDGQERARRERAVLDAAAAILERDAARDGDPTEVQPHANDLRTIGARNEYHEQTLAEWSGPVDMAAQADADDMRSWEARRAGG